MTAQIPKWWKWGYWVSPLTYTYNSLTVNEMYAPRWMNKKVHCFEWSLIYTSNSKPRHIGFSLIQETKASGYYIFIVIQASNNVTRLGVAVLESLEVYRNKNLYWVGVGALIGFSILFNVLFTLALTYLNRKY